MAYQDKFIEVDGLKTGYLEAGSGPAVVCLHGASLGSSAAKDAKPMWQRLIELRCPLLLMFGKNDRGNAFERATSMKEKFPQLDLHIVDDYKHLVQWDAMEPFHKLATAFLPK